MFNLTKEVQRLQQLKHDKIHGLPYKRKQRNPKIQQVDGNVFEINAEQEGKAIPHSFHNYSADFGKRLSKRKGQYHRPGGGFAGHKLRIV